MKIVGLSDSVSLSTLWGSPIPVLDSDDGRGRVVGIINELMKSIPPAIFRSVLCTVLFAPPILSADEAKLDGTTWRLDRMFSFGQPTPAPANDAPPVTIRFSGKSISGSGGCNTFRGTFRTNDRTLRLGGLAWTEKATHDQAVMKRESDFQKVLGKIRDFVVSKNTLILTDTDRLNMLHFTMHQPVAAKGLAGTSWKLNALESTEGETVSATTTAKNTTVDIQFGKDGKLAGTGGVNRYFATYQAGAKGSIQIGGIGSTRKAGPQVAMKQESAYFKQLGQMTQYEISGNLLKLSNKDGTRGLQFELTRK